MNQPDNITQQHYDLIRVVTRVESINSELSEIKAILASLTQVVSKLTLIEDRQTNMNSQVDKTQISIKELEDRIEYLERNDAKHSMLSKWAIGGVTGAFGTLATYIFTQIIGK